MSRFAGSRVIVSGVRSRARCRVQVSGLLVSGLGLKILADSGRVVASAAVSGGTCDVGGRFQVDATLRLYNQVRVSLLALRVLCPRHLALHHSFAVPRKHNSLSSPALLRPYVSSLSTLAPSLRALPGSAATPRTSPQMPTQRAC